MAKALLMALTISLSFSSLPSIPVFALAQSNQEEYLSTADLKILDSLEERFLFNKHQSLAVEERVEALEVQVFGERKKGALEERIAALQKATVGGESASLNSNTEITPSNEPSKSGDKKAIGVTVKQNNPRTETAEDLLEEATQQFGKGDISAAESTLKKVLVLDKHNADAYFNLGAIAEAKADVDSAIEEYQHCLQERPDDNEAQEALSAVKARRQPIDDKPSNSLRQDKLRSLIDYPLAQNNIPQGRAYSAVRAKANEVLAMGTCVTIFGGLAYFWWQDTRGGGFPGRWVSRTYPDFVRSSYDHKVAFLELNDSKGCIPNGPLGVKADICRPEDLSTNDYRVAVTSFGASQHVEDEQIEAVKEFVRRGGYLLVTGDDLRFLPRLVPEVIGCYSSQSWNQNSSGLCVDAELTEAAAPLAKGLSDNSRWCIPFECPILQILDTSRVSVLAVSQFVKAREPQGEGVLAALIPYGKGNILCCVGNIFIYASLATDIDPKMHMPLVDGLVANFMVCGFRRSLVQRAAKHS